VQTLDLNINFMQSASGPLHASAQVIGGGKTMCFCEGQVLDAQGAVVAQGMGTLRRG
jgi:acyl-coenzyme A thioesterase PaaI-like protein